MENRNLRTKTSTAAVEMAAAGGKLPPELIIYDIVSRLPAKTVGRFRCVSRHWKTLLSDSQFLKFQFTRNYNHQTKLILCQDYSFLSIDFLKDCNNSCNPIAICETLSFEPTNLRYTIRGSCNGLLLLYDSKNLELSIANPITHESWQLPAFPKSIRRHFCKFGFGYCSNDDEYTVVIISDFTCSSPVFMLKGNLWKRVQNSPLRVDTNCGFFVNGAIHWLCSGSRSRMIYAFDLASERFREVKQPKGLKEEDGFHVNVLGGYLCLVVRHENLAFDIWVMKEYGVRESWTKYVVCSSQDYGNIHPLFFWNDDESIVAVAQWRFVLCSLKQETLASIMVIGEGTPEHFYDGMWTFVDSLFSPNSSSNAQDQAGSMYNSLAPATIASSSSSMNSSC